MRSFTEISLKCSVFALLIVVFLSFTAIMFFYFFFNFQFLFHCLLWCVFVCSSKYGKESQPYGEARVGKS